MKIGVTAPGSSTNMFVNILLAKAGLKPDAVSIIGVGAAAGAVAIMKRGEIDAHLQPRSGHRAARSRRRHRRRSSTRARRRACRRSTAARTPRAASTCRSSSRRSIRTPRRRSSTRWCARCASSRQSTPDQIVAAVPPEYYADKALYKAALEKNLDGFKHDGVDRHGGGAERLPRSQDVRSRRAERDGRPREDDRHDVRSRRRRRSIK